MKKLTKKQLIESIYEYSRVCEKKAAKEKSEYKYYLLGRADSALFIANILKSN